MARPCLTQGPAMAAGRNDNQRSGISTRHGSVAAHAPRSAPVHLLTVGAGRGGVPMHPTQG